MASIVFGLAVVCTTSVEPDPMVGSRALSRQTWRTCSSVNTQSTTTSACAAVVGHLVYHGRAQLLEIAPLGVIRRVADQHPDVVAGRRKTRHHLAAHPPGADEPDFHLG